MSSFTGSAFRALALGAFALFLLHSGALTILRAAKWIGQAAPLAGVDYLVIRRSELGPAYVRGVERIRRAIPRDGEYLLVRGGTVWEGGNYWTRFELAPRRARYLGPWTELPDAETLRRQMPPGPRYVVIGYSEPRPPVLMEREDFLRELDRSHGGH